MKSITEAIRRNKINLLTTSCIYLAFFSHATGLSILGPSLLDLQAKTQSELSQVTYTIVGRAGGVGLGSFINIFLVSRFRRDTLLVAAFTVAAITEFACPFNTNIWLMIATLIINGSCFGINESICIKYLIDIWKKDCALFLQGFYLVFGLGALITPLVTRLFLVSPFEEGDQAPEDILLPAPEDVKIHWAFIINSILMAIVAVFAFFIRGINLRKEDKDNESTDSGADAAKQQAPTDKELSTTSFICKYSIYASSMIIIFLYCGIEISLGSYLTPFAVECSMHLSKKTAALMSSVYWASFTFGRILILPVLKYIGVFYCLVISFALVLLSNAFLFPFGDTLEWALWSGIVINGLGLSPIWASFFAFVDSFIPCSASYTSLVVIAACLGECVMPIIVSAFINQDPRMFLWIILASSIAMAVFFFILLAFLHGYRKSVTKK